jgi:hypothetical protein
LNAEGRIIRARKLKINMSHCLDITQSSFIILNNLIHTLNMSNCSQRSITDNGFIYLRGIHTLDLSGIIQPRLTDAALVHLIGISNLYITACTQFTEAGLAPLRAAGTNIIGP